MEIFGLLAPIAFVFSLGALARVASLKKELETINEEVRKMGEFLSK